ncbi:hypothetical protein D3C80_1713090 [compost metagenome]
MLAEHNRRSHCQVATSANAATGRQLFGFLQVEQDALAVIHIAPPRFSQAYAPGATCEQQCSQTIFQTSYHTSYAWR